MRQVVMLNRISLDGFFAGPNGEIDWFIHDPEIDKTAHDRGSSDTLLMGKATYEMFFGYWPNVAKDPNAPQEARATADELARMTKIVFSTTLPEVTWDNSKLLRGNLVEEVRALKQGEGTGIMLFGSGTLVQQLSDAELIDEYFLIVTPVVLGQGKPLFKDVKRLNLKHAQTWNFDSGNVMIRYTLK